jgi:hypothetical protein
MAWAFPRLPLLHKHIPTLPTQPPTHLEALPLPAPCLLPCLASVCPLQEGYQPMLDELDFLQDQEQNDGRLMLFQLPSLLPVAAQQPPETGAAGTSEGGAAAARVAASRPTALKDLPSSRIGKLLVFESGKVKMQVGRCACCACCACCATWFAAAGASQTTLPPLRSQLLRRHASRLPHPLPHSLPPSPCFCLLPAADWGCASGC